MSVKVQSKFKRYSELFHKDIPYAKITVPEKIVIRGVPIRTINWYDVPQNQLHNQKCYFPLLNDPTRNTRNINKAYCNKVGLLNYNQIQQIISKYGFSIRHFANILGISPATLCNVKNGKVIPSKLLSTLLSLLSNKNNMKIILKNQNAKTKSNHKA